MSTLNRKKWDVSIETKCQGMDLDIQDQYHAISYPIYQTATFSHRQLGESSGFDYTRQSNPTRQQLESIVTILENGADTIAFSSGMAAVATLMELLQPGDHILIDADLYGGSVRLFDVINKKNGLEFTAADLSTEPAGPLLRENTRAVYLESPTNPMMHVTDIRALADELEGKGILLIVDNTFLSLYFQNPLDLGADIVVHSATKFFGGHHDTIGGFLVAKDEKIAERLHYLATTIGCAISPFDSWLMIRGIRTLAVRMERAAENTEKIARWMKDCPYVTDVLYPGLPEHPGHEIMKKQARGYGAMLSFYVPSREFAVSVLNHVELFYFAESLGGTETLITYPLTQTHAEVPEEIRERNGINDRLLRLSVGIEGAEDLIAELDRVFRIAAAEMTR